MNIEAGEALVYEGGYINYSLVLQGTNRLTSTGGPGINFSGVYNINFRGSGSLIVTGGDGAVGIQADALGIYEMPSW